MSLRDLHPASWYSVAWYPIYRIPQGAFRASFLTYHSLGHAAQRRRTPPGGSPVGGDGCIVSPPLGMESYNAQGEGWLEPREGAASGALEGRLGAMGRAASVFSRGTVRRGPAQVRNNHPDYEFFLSRK
ncbi:unnamed protein product [Spirodela intermedia]|uniref:Uncharacterized protein n=1 Tax=Spirodela intermedia TaxID=51605 RepID=A0A7I8K6H1_SPIIN|nr:unnamed protein product [Spirodela intermedia]